MSIKSDLWIRRMADQHKMIEPFEAGQVRDKDGERLEIAPFSLANFKAIKVKTVI